MSTDSLPIPGMPEPLQRTLLGVGRDVAFNSKAVLQVAGVKNPDILIVTSGFVAVQVQAGHDRCATVAVLRTGDVIGVDGFLDSTETTTQAVALGLVTVRAYSAPLVRRMSNENPFLRGFLSQASRRLTQRMTELFRCTLPLNVGERVAEVLIYLASLNVEEGKIGHMLPMPLLRAELAQMARTTEESTIINVSRWKRLEVVIDQKGVITIPNVQRLRIAAAQPMRPSKSKAR